MSDESSTEQQSSDNNDGKASGTTSPESKTEFQPITTQEDLNKVLAHRLERERAKFSDYTDLKAKAEKFDELEEAKKTEQQKQADALQAMTGERDQAVTALLRHRVAAEKGLNADAVELLSGSTKEDVEKSADSLLKLINDSGKPRSPKPVAGQGHNGAQSAPSGDWLRDQFLNKR